MCVSHLLHVHTLKLDVQVQPDDRQVQSEFCRLTVLIVAVILTSILCALGWLTHKYSK